MGYSPARLICGVVFLLLLSTIPAGADDLVLGKKKGEWVEMLRTDKEAKKRKAAVMALGIVGPTIDDVDRALGDALANDAAPEVRQQVLIEVRKIKKELLPKWTQRMGNTLKYDKHAPNRVLALSVLGRLEDLAKPVLSNVLAAGKDPEPTVRAAAAETLGRIGPDARDGVPDLIAMLKDKDFAVRLNAVAALGRLAEVAGEAVPDLLNLLASETETELRKEVVRVLGSFGDSAGTGVRTLVKVLKEDKNEEIRQQAVLSLGKIGSDARRVIEELKACLRQDQDKTVRLYLIRTMTSILSTDAPLLAKDYATQLGVEKDTDLKLAFLQELAAMGDKAKEVLPMLKSVLEDPSVVVRKEAKVTIERITAKPAPKKD